MSACDMRDTEDHRSYMVTGATDTQRQESTHNVPLDTTLPAPEAEVPETPQDPNTRLADVLAYLQKKAQSMTIQSDRSRLIR